MNFPYAYVHDDHVAFYLTEKPAFGSMAISSVIRDLEGKSIPYESRAICYRCGRGVALLSSQVIPVLD